MLVDEVKELPQKLPLEAWAQEEWDRTPEPDRRRFVRKSEHTWLLHGPDGEILLIAGIYSPTLVGRTPEFWMLLCEGFKHNLRRNLLFARDKVEDLLDMYPRVMVQVDAEFPVGQKFATFMGFEKVTKAQHINGRDYIVYEVTR